jgi:PAS domain S-box-containing protein
VLFRSDGLSHYERVDFISDSIIAILLICAVSYNVVSMNTRALARARTEIARREKTQASLLVANQRLQALVEELEATNEEFEAQNEELTAAYNEIKSSQIMMDILYRTSPAGIALIRDRKIVLVNEHFCAMTGYGDREMVGSDARMLYESDEEYVRVGGMLRAARIAGGNHSGETRWKRSDGSRLDILLRITWIAYSDVPADYIVVAIDITAMKNVEEMLRQGQEHFRKMIELSPLPIIITKKDGTVEYVNREFDRVLGGLDEGMTTIDQWLDRAFSDPGSREKARAYWEAVARGDGTAAGGAGATEWNVAVTDGAIRCVEVSASVIVDMVLLVLNDQSEKKLIQEMIIRHEKMMTVGAMAAGMAHEINNPLSVIVQGIQMARSRVLDDSRGNVEAAAAAGISLEGLRRYLSDRGVLDYLAGGLEAGMRASRIISNMLRFSRKDGPGREHRDINELIDNAIEIASSEFDLKKRFDMRKIEIRRSFGRDIPPVWCNPTEIEQVVINLLKNAAQAVSEREDVSSVIEISTGREHDHAVIVVADNGVGIPPETIRHIFDPFYTTKPAGMGTGLGLSISYFIVTGNHGGTISVVSEPGSGSAFTVKLPYEGAGHERQENQGFGS